MTDRPALLRFQERFEQIAPDDEDACWEWPGARNSDGYGVVRVGGALKLAHRIAHEIYVGPIPRGLEILHSCDNPACVNYRHLTPGTHRQNMIDAASRGRLGRRRLTPTLEMAHEQSAASERPHARPGDAFPVRTL